MPAALFFRTFAGGAGHSAPCIRDCGGVVGMPRPTTGRFAVSEARPDVSGAVYEFLLDRIRPPLRPDQIVLARQNLVSPPEGDCALVSLARVTRRGTNVETPVPASDGEPSGLLTVARLAVYDVDIHFCGPDQDAAAARADMLELLAGDARSVDFFRARGLGCLYADSPRRTSFENENRRWETRFTTTLHLSGWLGLDAAADFFDSVAADIALTGRAGTYVENVDAHHQPSGGTQWPFPHRR